MVAIDTLNIIVRSKHERLSNWAISEEEEEEAYRDWWLGYILTNKFNLGNLWVNMNAINAPHINLKRPN